MTFKDLIKKEKDLDFQNGIQFGLQLRDARQEFLRTTSIYNMRKTKYKKLYNKLFNLANV